jgi:hypothetical protein
MDLTERLNMNQAGSLDIREGYNLDKQRQFYLTSPMQPPGAEFNAIPKSEKVRTSYRIYHGSLYKVTQRSFRSNIGHGCLEEGKRHMILVVLS